MSNVINLNLWNKVCTTDPSHVTEASVSGQKRKTVRAAFQKEKATELFGIYGIDWGVEVGSESYDQITIGDTVLLQYTAVMFFNFEQRKGRMPIAASVKLAYKTSGGNGYLKVDEEAIKKVRTDALTKGLSELGFNADIFKGWMDNDGYAAFAAEETADKLADKHAEETIAEAEGYAEWKEKEMAIYPMLKTIKAITTAHTNQVRKANKVGDKAGVVEFTKLKDARIEELRAAKAEKANG